LSICSRVFSSLPSFLFIFSIARILASMKLFTPLRLYVLPT
jgi:hypothetical protein